MIFSKILYLYNIVIKPLIMGRKTNDGRGRMGGRAAGTKNKPLEPLNVWVNGLINRRRAQFEKDLDECSAQERAAILAGLIASTGTGTPATSTAQE